MDKSSSWLSQNIKSLLTLIMIVCTYAILILLIVLCRDQPTVISQILIGVLSLATGVGGYYYGYSQGASKKDEAAITAQANSQTTTTTKTPAP